jgi:hypothetical protein
MNIWVALISTLVSGIIFRRLFFKKCDRRMIDYFGVSVAGIVVWMVMVIIFHIIGI